MAAPAASAESARRKNPVLWQEHVHQQRNAPAWMRYARWLVIAAPILMIVGTLYVFDQTNGYPAMEIALYFVWALQIGLAIRAISAGANAISREHVGQTWDALVLTNVSARDILLGKWQAALHSVRGWMLTLGMVRLAMLPVFSLGLTKVYASVFTNQYYYTNSYDQARIEFGWVPWAWMLAVILSVALTILDTLVCTAIGLAASALTRRGVIAGVVGIIVRFLPVMLFAGFVRYQLGDTFFWRWWGNTQFSLADAGTSAMMVLALPNMPWTRGDHTESLPGLILATTLLVVLLVVSILTTWIVIRRTGALPRAYVRPLPAQSQPQHV